MNCFSFCNHVPLCSIKFTYATVRTYEVHEATDDAEWRRPAIVLTTVDFLARESARGKPVSPLFCVFGVFTCLFKVDWLHAVDKGVAADYIGNLFIVLVPKLPGRNQQQRCNYLSDLMVEYWKANNVEDRLKLLWT